MTEVRIRRAQLTHEDGSEATYIAAKDLEKWTLDFADKWAAASRQAESNDEQDVVCIAKGCLMVCGDVIELLNDIMIWPVTDEET